MNFAEGVVVLGWVSLYLLLLAGAVCIVRGLVCWILRKVFGIRNFEITNTRLFK